MKELFLVFALALVPASARDVRGTPDQRAAFIKEYGWLMDLLTAMYPKNEFMIMPVQYPETPPGWTWISEFGWRGHLLYRRSA